MTLIKNILDKNEKEIIQTCQNYLRQVELENKHPMTPDIDEILKWMK